MIDYDKLCSFHEGFCNDARAVAVQRGDEYANREDELRTFRVAAELYGCKPSDVARMQICLKTARLQNNPSKDTLLDLVNFTIYFWILKCEEKAQEAALRPDPKTIG